MAAGYSSLHNSQIDACFFLFSVLRHFNCSIILNARLGHVMPSTVSVCMTFAVRRARGIHALERRQDSGFPGFHYFEVFALSSSSSMICFRMAGGGMPRISRPLKNNTGVLLIFSLSASFLSASTAFSAAGSS